MLRRSLALFFFPPPRERLKMSEKWNSVYFGVSEEVRTFLLFAGKKEHTRVLGGPGVEGPGV